MTVAAAADPVAGLRALLPEDCVLSGEAAYPGSVWERPPRAVAFPRSSEEAAIVLARASEAGWTVEPAGSGTWLRSGNPGAAPDLVLSAARLDGVVEHEPGDLTVTVGAGVRLSVLDQHLAGHGQWLPLDPPGRQRTLGAVASTGVWGALGAAWGGPRDLVLGLSAVTGDGRVFRAGGKVVKNVAGFDLVRLLIGSRGTLAFFSEITLRLFPRPAVDRTLVLRAAALGELVGAARVAVSQSVTPAAVELLERFLPLDGRREAVLGVRFVGNAERVRAEEDLIRGALSRSGAEPEMLDGDSAGAFWDDVRLLEEDADLVLTLAAPPERLTEVVELARAVGRMPDGRDLLATTPVRMALQAGTGALRLSVPNVRVESGWDARWAERLEDLRRALARRGGSLTVTRADASIVERLGAWERPGPAAELMAGLKAVFDPAGILSVGRFVQGLVPSGEGGPAGGVSPEER